MAVTPPRIMSLGGGGGATSAGRDGPTERIAPGGEPGGVAAWGHKARACAARCHQAIGPSAFRGVSGSAGGMSHTFSRQAAKVPAVTSSATSVGIGCECMAAIGRRGGIGGMDTRAGLTICKSGAPRTRYVCVTMIIKLCKKGLDRAGAVGAETVDALRDREHSVVVRDCLDRCGACEKGTWLALVDGMPIGAASAPLLLSAVDELAADEP